MSRLIVLLSFVVIAVSAAPSGTDDILSRLLKEYQDLLPTEIIETYKSLTAQDKALLKDVFKNIKEFKDEKELVAAIKEKDPELGKKVGDFFGKIQEKVDGLSSEPKAFAKQLIDNGRRLHHRYASGEKIELAELQGQLEAQIDKYTNLSVAAQDELKAAFPGFVKLLKDDKVKVLAVKLLEGDEN